MRLFFAGLDHHTAPLEVRERVALPREKLKAACRALREGGGASEALLLSTCNRTEAYVVSDSPDGGARALDALLVTLSSPPPRDSEAWRLREGEGASQHLFRVAAGLESAILGETEIQGQVRTSHDDAVAAGTVGKVLDRLVRGALHAGKRARAETPIGTGGLSHGGAAAEVARRVFGDLRDRGVLVVGAGAVAQQAARALAGLGGGRFVVANRTLEHAEAIAREVPSAHATGIEGWTSNLKDSHVVVLAAEGVPLGLSDAQAALHRRRDPLLVVDLGMPRAADPLLATLPGVFLYDLEDLEALVQATIATRRAAIPAAEAIVADEHARFVRWTKTLGAHGTIRSLSAWAEEVRRAELAALPPGTPAELLRAVDELTRRLVQRLLDRPASRVVKGMEAEDPTLPTAEHLRHLFGLEEGRDS